MKPASLSVLVLVPLAITKFRRYSVGFPFQIYELVAGCKKVMQVVEGYVVHMDQ